MSIYDKASLVLIPSGTKTSKVYSQKPTNGDGDFTFSRSTAATRVNASGNIEKEASNLLLQSNTFDTTWTLTGSTLVGGQSDKDGGTDAWKLTSSNTGQSFVKQVVSSSGVATYSVYAKAGTANFIVAYAVGGGDPRTFFDLQNGTTETAANNITNKIEDVGNGWYRCSVIFNKTITDVRLFIADSDNVFNSGNGSSIYIQDAQLEQGLVARDYIETTTTAIYGGITDNVPRLDYTDSSCPALLLEPQRSNLVPFSEHLESSDWAKTRCTIEDNSTTSPEGVMNASKMTSTDASESYIQDNLATTGTKITWSFFAKKGDLDYAHGLVWDLSANGCRQWFNLSTGAVGGTTTFGSGYSVDSATIEDYGNGWYRCAMVVNSTAGTQGCRVNISSADTTISSAVNSYGYFYGIQLEDASYATSYIPTYGSAVTRNVDSCSKTGVSSLIGQTEGTLFAEVSVDTDSVSSLLNRVISVTDGTLSNRVLIVLNTDETFRFIIIGGGSTLANITTSASALNGFHKVALGYKANDYVAYVDGVQVGSNTTAASVPSSLSQAFLGSVEAGATSSVLEGSFKQSLMFKTRLTNAELADLTTL